MNSRCKLCAACYPRRMHLLQRFSSAIPSTVWFSVLLAALALPACGEDGPPSPAGSGEAAVVEIAIEQEGGEAQMLSVTTESGASALQAMQSAEGLELEIEGAGRDAYITAINGRAASADQGWVFAINGESSQVGVGAATVQNGDMLRWCYVSWKDREACGTPAGPGAAKTP